MGSSRRAVVCVALLAAVLCIFARPFTVAPPGAVRYASETVDCEAALKTVMLIRCTCSDNEKVQYKFQSEDEWEASVWKESWQFGISAADLQCALKDADGYQQIPLPDDGSYPIPLVDFAESQTFRTLLADVWPPVIPQCKLRWKLGCWDKELKKLRSASFALAIITGRENIKTDARVCSHADTQHGWNREYVNETSDEGADDEDEMEELDPEEKNLQLKATKKIQALRRNQNRQEKTNIDNFDVKGLDFSRLIKKNKKAAEQRKAEKTKAEKKMLDRFVNQGL